MNTPHRKAAQEILDLINRSLFKHAESGGPSVSIGDAHLADIEAILERRAPSASAPGSEQTLREALEACVKDAERYRAKRLRQLGELEVADRQPYSEHHEVKMPAWYQQAKSALSAQPQVQEANNQVREAEEAMRLCLHALGNHHEEQTTGMRAYNAIRNYQARYQTKHKLPTPPAPQSSASLGEHPTRGSLMKEILPVIKAHSDASAVKVTNPISLSGDIADMLLSRHLVRPATHKQEGAEP